jgi:hypothetical protein
MASTDARPVPIKNTAFRAVFPLLDADGDLVTGAAGLDSEVSKDQGTFADCTNEATEIATSSGMYYLDLTSTEMNADCVAVIVKTSTTGAKTTVLVFYPQEAGDIKTDVQSTAGQIYTSAAVATDGGNSATTIKTTLSQTSDGFWIDAWLLITSGSLAGEVKLVTGYNGTSKVVTVAGGFTGTPADGVTFVLINR